MIGLNFLSPEALVLLVLAPLLVFIAMRSGVHMPRDRAVFSLILRLVVLGLLVMALASPRLLQRAESLSTVFLLDASDSITPDQVNAETDWVRQAIAKMGPKDQAGVVVFGGNALVEQPMSHLEDLPNLSSQPAGADTAVIGLNFPRPKRWRCCCSCPC
ncbi:MAG: VWA domain-containing protein [Chloroflexi bacterium]|nr:VWA domain-containing protein [Chloroflexota bacterium]